MYDLTNRTSFSNILNWYNDICANVDDPKNLQLILCGNKKDLVENIQISTEEGQNLARNLNMNFFETSALSGENIYEAFATLIDALIAL